MAVGGSRSGVIVVTGASRGLGAGMARAFRSAGHPVAACARTEPTLSDALTAAVDVADAGAVERFAARAASELGPVALWVNNAGVLGPIGPLRDAEPAAVAENLSVNLLGVLHGSQAFLRHRRTGDAVLVNISSGAASSPYEGWGPYCSAKAAVEMLTAVLAREEPGIRAYAVAPGVVDTDMQAEIRATPPERFPAVDRFQRLEAEGAFNAPGWVAAHLLDLAFGDLRPSGTRWRVPDET